MDAIQIAREEFQDNLKQLQARTRKFGRVDSFTAQNDKTAVRPFPHYFAWNTDEKRKVGSAAVKSIKDQLREKVDHAPPPSVVKKDKPSVPTIEKVVESSKKKDPSISKGMLDQGLPIDNEKVVAPMKETIHKTTDINNVRGNDFNVQPKTTKPANSSIEKGIKRGGQAIGQGGGRGIAVMDPLSLLCRQHHKQYGSAVSKPNDSGIAGATRLKDAVAPTFFAWEQEPETMDLPSETKNDVHLSMAKEHESYTALERLQLRVAENERKLEELALTSEQRVQQPTAPIVTDNTIKHAEEPRVDIEAVKAATQPSKQMLISSPPAHHKTTTTVKAPVPLSKADRIQTTLHALNHSQDAYREALATKVDTAAPKPIQSEKTRLLAQLNMLRKRQKIRQQRAVGSKHCKLLSEAGPGYIRRTEHMENFRWPATDLPEGGIRCVSAYATRQVSRPAGAKSTYHTTLVESGEDALRVARTAGSQFLRKKLVPGSIEYKESNQSDIPQNATDIQERSALWRFKSKRPISKSLPRWKPTMRLRLENPVIAHRKYANFGKYRPQSEYQSTHGKTGKLAYTRKT